LQPAYFSFCKNNCEKREITRYDTKPLSTNHVEYITGKINQRLGLLNRVKHLMPFSARLLFYNSLVTPLFDHADLVWRQAYYVTLMTCIQVLQNKAAKIILDRPLNSSTTHALANLKWIPLEKRTTRLPT